VLRFGSLVMAAAVGAAGCGAVSRSPTVGAQPAPGSVVLRGAGVNSAFPIYEEIGSQLAGQGITLNYQLSGSGPATASFRAGRIAFLSADGSRFAGNLPRIGTTSALYVPVGFISVAVIFHLPSVHARLKLSGKTLAGMFGGAIRRWDSPVIAHENPGVRLPSTPIAIVHGAGPSDATGLFTGYLAAASKSWRRSIGSGRAVNWPGGTPEDGNAQTEAAVGQTVGAIGYVEQPGVLGSGLAAAQLLNPKHAYVPPTMRTTSAVGDGPRSVGSLSLDTLNTPVATAYPIASEAYVMVYRDLCVAGLTPRQAAATQQFLTYLLGPGQATVRQVSFAPLPSGLRASALAAVRRLSCEAQSI
jgi:phosphate transport system substrate-binding protein